MKNPVKPALPASNTALKVLSFLALAVLCALFFLLMRQLSDLRRSANEVAQTTQLRNAL